jgi:hypothetical protein
MTTDPNSPTAQTPEATLHLDEDGVPILDEVAEALPQDEIAISIKTQLLAELRPQLRDLVQQAMTESIKACALEFKHTFERQLDEKLEMQLRELVEQTVERACRDAG